MQWLRRPFNLTFWLAFLALFLLSIQAAHADPSAPDSVNVFTLSPDPQTQGQNVTIDVNADMANTNGDNVVYLCIYEPDTNAPSTNPSSFILAYYNSGSVTNGRDVTFNETAQGGAEPTCPAQPGQTSVLYKSAPGSVLPNTRRNYRGTITWPIYSGATTGTYTWTLYAFEATGAPNMLSDTHTIAAPTAIDLQRVAATTPRAPFPALAATLLLAGTAFLLRRRIA